jgi:hypothetical protein
VLAIHEQKGPVVEAAPHDPRHISDAFVELIVQSVDCLRGLGIRSCRIHPRRKNQTAKPTYHKRKEVAGAPCPGPHFGLSVPVPSMC